MYLVLIALDISVSLVQPAVKRSCAHTGWLNVFSHSTQNKKTLTVSARGLLGHGVYCRLDQLTYVSVHTGLMI